jgi:Fe-Mn family superoxide dismutase
MELHHTKHHQTYVNGLNAAEKSYSSADIKGQIKLQAALKFNGGGHINHSLFWKNLAPTAEGGGKLGDGALKSAIEKDFGGVDKMIEKFNAATAAIQGSGWGWLGYNEATKQLEIVTTANQDPLVCACLPFVSQLWLWMLIEYLQRTSLSSVSIFGNTLSISSTKTSNPTYVIPIPSY